MAPTAVTVPILVWYLRKFGQWLVDNHELDLYDAHYDTVPVEEVVSEFLDEHFGILRS